MTQRRTAIVEGFWAIPGGMALAGLVLGELCVRAESHLGLGKDLYLGDAGAALTLLSAIAGASLTVASTTFSIVIAVVTLVGTQMGPRLMRNFRLDGGNKICLGVLLLTFTHCLATLRAVTSSPDGGFVPHLGVIVAAILALGCVGSLIAFIHRTTFAMDVTTVVSRVQNDLERALIEASEPGQEREPLPAPMVWGAPVRSRGGGYLQEVDLAGLRSAAREAGALVALVVRPGDYVGVGTVVAMVEPAGAFDPIPFAVLGERRTPEGDLEYSVRQLVEIAVRALSPAINDPFTAISSVDRLGDALRLLRGRRLRRIEGEVSVPTTDFDGLLDACFTMILHAGASTPALTIRVLEVLAWTAEGMDPVQRAVLHRYAAEALDRALSRTESERDRRDLRERFERCRNATRVD